MATLHHHRAGLARSIPLHRRAGPLDPLHHRVGTCTVPGRAPAAGNLDILTILTPLMILGVTVQRIGYRWSYMRLSSDGPNQGQGSVFPVVSSIPHSTRPEANFIPEGDGGRRRLPLEVGGCYDS